MHSKSKSLFVNTDEFVYTPGALEPLLMFQDNNEEPTNEISVDVGKNNNSNRSGIGGQPSLISKFPGIVDEVTEFVKQHGFAAQSS